ncbi:MAG: SAM-dependent chlorinase/fluorinase [Bacteroidales bacterium]|nr:SAM-dependent chlorinase/fluorinase [Bacteroidales bacterium]
MAIITLTSDWGYSDFYVAAVKGTILSQIPDAVIVDISHDIAPFNVRQAGFVLKNCFRDFPQGTIHIIGINSIESKECPHVVIKADGHFFIAADNGVFGQILTDFEEAVTIEVPQDTDSFNFVTRDRFVKVAAMIANGVPLSEIGSPYKRLNGGLFCAVVRDNSIEGHVIHIDSYGNLITNITKEVFELERRGRQFKILVKGNFYTLYTIDKISDSYLDVDKADLVAVFGSHGNLEIALNRAKLATLCGIELDSPILVKFGEDDVQPTKVSLF